MGMKDELGDRMKEYEAVPKNTLMRKTPVILRIDGKAFHTFTRGFRKPFDDVLAATMQDTMKYLCENIQGARLGYTQSDEITIFIADYETARTCPWFGYEVEKICSIASSMATLAFNKAFTRRIAAFNSFDRYRLEPWQEAVSMEEQEAYFQTLENAAEKGALFDARCFNLPQHEVANCFIWRQADAMRNSVFMVAQANFNHRELQGLDVKACKEKLVCEKNISWDDDYNATKKWGSCCIKRDFQFTADNGKPFTRGKWVIDEDTPLFVKNREYVEELVHRGNY